MSVTEDAGDPAVDYYDSDYPSPSLGSFHENVPDGVTEVIAHDLERYRDLARTLGGPVLELCCGTGRLAIPLAADGHTVIGVDRSAAMLARARTKLARVPAAAPHLRLLLADATTVRLPPPAFAVVLLAFNSLVCMPDPERQRAALRTAAAHLADNGTLAIDCSNPYLLDPAGDSEPRLLFTRRNEANGRTYRRFHRRGSMTAGQVFPVTGWYEETDPFGQTIRRDYAARMRPVYPYELELMLEIAGLEVQRINGGHRNEPFTATSTTMFVLAGHRATRMSA